MKRFVYIHMVFSTASRNLLSHKLRSMLNLMGIICGACAVLSMISIGQGAQKKIQKEIEKLGAQNLFIQHTPMDEEMRNRTSEKASLGLTRFDAERIEQGVPQVAEVACIRNFTAAVHGFSQDISFGFAACTANYSRVLNLGLLKGRFISDLDIVHKNPVCVIGKTPAKELGAEAQTGKYLRIGGIPFLVVGILREVELDEESVPAVSFQNTNEMIFVPLGADLVFQDTEISFSTRKEERIDEIAVSVTRSAQVIETGKLIQRILEVTHNGVLDYQMIIPKALLVQAKKSRRILNAVLAAIASISLIVGGIGIMNIMLATVSERKREIGIRRAVGATKKDIAIQFLAEAVLLTALGGMIGIIAGTAAVVLVSRLSGIHVSISILGIFISLAMAVFTGIFFGYYPAGKAAGLDPVAALRNE